MLQEERLFYLEPWKPEQYRAIERSVYYGGGGGYKLADGDFFCDAKTPQELTIWLLENEHKFVNDLAFLYWFDYQSFRTEAEKRNDRYLLKRVIPNFSERRQKQGLTRFIYQNYLDYLKEVN